MEAATALLEELAWSPDRSVRTYARIEALGVRIDSDPHGALSEAQTLLAEILPELERDGDDVGLARARLLEAMTEWLRSRAEPATVAVRRALEHACRVHDVRRMAEAAFALSGASIWGPANQEEQAAIAAELDDLAGESGGAMVGADALRAWAATARGEFETAHMHAERAAAMSLALGEEIPRLAYATHFVILALYEGLPELAVELAEENYREMLAAGATSYASTQAQQLAEALYLCGRHDEAERISIEGEQLGTPEDIVNVALGHGIRARIAADAGDLSTARQLVEEALAAALRTDFPIVHGDAFVAEAHVERAAGRSAEERAALERALAAYRSKGDAVKAAEAERLLAALTPTG
jgi:tetratricopeptide (TPR) repeat protein